MTVAEVHRIGGSDPGAVQRWASDLSGRYGPFYVDFTASRSSTRLEISGGIYDPATGQRVGSSTRSFFKGRNGEWEVHHDLLSIQQPYQGNGFSTAYYATLEAYYRRSNLSQISIHAALDRGGYAWARRGFIWDTRPSYLSSSLSNIRNRIDDLTSSYSNISDADKATLRALLPRLVANNPRLPKPSELANLTGDYRHPDVPTRANGLGLRLMSGSDWFGIFPLR